MAGIGNQVGIQQEAPKTGAEVTQTHNSFSVGTATALLALSLVAGQAGAETKKVDPLQTGAQSTLLAQAEIGQTGPYTAEVIQVDGTRKVIKYFRDKEGAIIPPTVVDGKLVDGSTAPDHPLRAKNAQVKILAKYDKNAQLMLAAVSKEDILGKANNTLKDVLNLAEQGKLITKEQLYDGFFSAYIFNISYGNGKADKAISGLESIAKIKMKMNESEIAQIKQNAEIRAKNIWKSVTGALA